MTEDDWDVSFAKSIAVYLNGHGIRSTDERGEEVKDDHFYLAFNASMEAIEFTLPSSEYAGVWTVVLDTAEMNQVEPIQVKPGEAVSLAAHAMVVMSSPLRTA